MKQTHVKPNLYAYYFIELKEIAKECGYNLVVHGSMARDLDLIAIPWVDDPKPEMDLINAFCDYINGRTCDFKEQYLYSVLPGGRHSYVINLNRGGFRNYGHGLETEYLQDPEYYIDISVTPLVK
jgi:hypothetical protein